MIDAKVEAVGEQQGFGVGVPEPGGGIAFRTQKRFGGMCAVVPRLLPDVGIAAERLCM